MSSAYMFTIIFSAIPGIWYPFNVGDWRSAHASGSIARSKSKQDSGSPCLTPRVTLKGVLRNPLIATLVYADWYRFFIVFVNMGGRWNASRVSIKYVCFILLYAFS